MAKKSTTVVRTKHNIVVFRKTVDKAQIMLMISNVLEEEEEEGAKINENTKCTMIYQTTIREPE